MSHSRSIPATLLFIISALSLFLLPALQVSAAVGPARASVSGSGFQSNDWSSAPSLAADGSVAAFESYATNLVSSDTNGHVDVFVRDFVGGTTERASIGSNGEQANGWSLRPSISGDGRFIAFQSWASNLVPGDTNGTYDIFVRDRALGVTALVSVPRAGESMQPSQASVAPAISADGRYVAFETAATNLTTFPAAGSAAVQILRRDLALGVTSLVTASYLAPGMPASGDSHEPTISEDGRFVAFWSEASNLTSQSLGGHAQVFRRDMSIATSNPSATIMVSVGSEKFISTMSPTLMPAPLEPSDRGSFDPVISADGLAVAFRSSSTNLVCNDQNGSADIFVRDLHDPARSQTGIVSGSPALHARQGLKFPASESQSARTPTLGDADDGSHQPAISRTGRYVAFESDAANIVAGDSNNKTDVFVHDRLLGTTSRVSVDASGAQVPDWSFDVSISGDGSSVAFMTLSALVAADTNKLPDIYAVGLSTVSPPSIPGGPTIAAPASLYPSPLKSALDNPIRVSPVPAVTPGTVLPTQLSHPITVPTVQAPASTLLTQPTCGVFVDGTPSQFGDGAP